MREGDAGLVSLAKDWQGPDMDRDFGADLILLEETVKGIFSEFIFYEEDDPEEARIMEFDHVITPEEAKTGKLPLGIRTSLRQPGTRLRHWISCISFAKVYYEVLADRTITYNINASEEEKAKDIVAYLIMYDSVFKLGHGRFLKHWREEGKI